MKNYFICCIKLQMQKWGLEKRCPMSKTLISNGNPTRSVKRWACHGRRDRDERKTAAEKVKLPGRGVSDWIGVLSCTPAELTPLPHCRKSSENVPLPGSHRWVIREGGISPFNEKCPRVPPSSSCYTFQPSGPLHPRCMTFGNCHIDNLCIHTHRYRRLRRGVLLLNRTEWREELFVCLESRQDALRSLWKPAVTDSENAIKTFDSEVNNNQTLESDSVQSLLTLWLMSLGSCTI